MWRGMVQNTFLLYLCSLRDSYGVNVNFLFPIFGKTNDGET